MYIKLIAKPPAFVLFAYSGSPFDRRIAFRSAREAAFGSAGRPAAGFRWLRGRTHLPQKRRNRPVNPYGRQPTPVVAALPRKPQVRNARARQPELGESGHDQPRPPIRLLGVANPRRRPSHALLEEAQGVLQIETPDIRAPEEIQVRPRPLRPVPPQPQDPWLPPPFAAGQPLDLDQDERADHDGQGSPSASSLVVLDLRVHLRPRPNAHSPVAGVLAAMLCGGLGPGARIVALHLRPVATGASDVLRRVAEARIAVEAAPGAQAEEYLARTALQCSLHLDGVVARVEDEQGDGLSLFEPTQQSLDLLGGDHVGVLGGPEALYVHGGGPALAHEVEPCNELVGPSCDDGLSGRVTGRMVVVAALGTRLRVASGPHARVHGVDGRLPFGAGERM